MNNDYKKKVTFWSIIIILCLIVLSTNVFSVTYCYQEQINSSINGSKYYNGNCLLYYNGTSYTDLTGDYRLEGFDGDWVSGETYLDKVYYSNWTKANNSIGAYYRISSNNEVPSDAVGEFVPIDVLIPSDCWNAYAGKIVLKRLGGTLSNLYLTSYCYNGSSYVLLDNSSGKIIMVEDGVNWIINSTASSSNGTTFNSSSDLSFVNIESDNYCVIGTGGWSTCDETKYSYTYNNTINAYPTVLGSGLAYSQLNFIINNTVNGYSKHYCDYKGQNIAWETLYNIDFNLCSSTSDCGFDGVSSVYQWNTYIFDSSNGRQLDLYNGTFAFSKKYWFPDAYGGYNSYKLDFDYRPSISSDNTNYPTTTLVSLINPYSQEMINIEIVRDNNVVTFYTLDDANFYWIRGEIGSIDNYDTTNPIEVSITYYLVYNDTLDRSDYSYYVTANIKGDDNIMTTDVYTSYTTALLNQNSINGNYGIYGMRLTTVNEGYGTYIDNILLSGLIDSSGPYLDVSTTPETITCLYDIGKCYLTRIYYSLNENDWTTFKDFKICGVNDEDHIIQYSNGTTYTISVTGNGSITRTITTADVIDFDKVDVDNDGTYLGTAPLSTRIIVVILIVILSVGAIFVAGQNANINGNALGILGVIVAFIELILCVWLRILPWWVMLFAIIMASIYSASNIFSYTMSNDRSSSEVRKGRL